MSEPTLPTQRFGFTRIGQGENISKDGYAALDGDRAKLDDILHALVNHTHDGGSSLSNPTTGLTHVIETTGGNLPADTTFYYRYTLVDRWGLETAASPEIAVTTPEGIEAPVGPSLFVESSGGSQGPGEYAYSLTFVGPDGGETSGSPETFIRIASGESNRIRLTLPELPSGAVAIRIYRARPGQTLLYFLDETDQETYYDDGALSEDLSILVPVMNDTSGSNAVELTVPSLPPQAFGWKLYRSVEPGVYDGWNLVHHVVETEFESGGALRDNWTDYGDILTQGVPPSVNATMGGGSFVDLSQFMGQIPDTAIPRGSRLWSVSMSGEIEDRTYSRTRFTSALKPSRLTLFFGTPPVIGSGESMTVSVVDSMGNDASLILGTGVSGVDYHELVFPDAEEGFAEAEQGDRSSNAPIINDLSASDGQAVHLQDENEWVEYNFGALSSGTYTPYVSARIDDTQPATPGVATFEVIRKDSSQVIGSVQLDLELQTFVETQGQIFNAPGGSVEVAFRVTKSDAVDIGFIIDNFRFEANVPSLVAGLIDVEVTFGGATPQPPTNPGSDAELCVWF